jgi:hypothetical protein
MSGPRQDNYEFPALPEDFETKSGEKAIITDETEEEEEVTKETLEEFQTRVEKALNEATAKALGNRDIKVMTFVEFLKKLGVEEEEEEPCDCTSCKYNRMEPIQTTIRPDLYFDYFATLVITVQALDREYQHHMMSFDLGEATALRTACNKFIEQARLHIPKKELLEFQKMPSMKQPASKRLLEELLKD